MRVQVWQPGTIPADTFAHYSMERFPAIRDRAVSVVTALCARKDLRGSTSVVALTTAGAEIAVRDHGVEVLFAECRPGLLRAYRKLGLRPFGGRPVDFHGLAVPVVAITGDLDHLAAVGSPWLPMLRKLKRSGQFPTREWQSLAAVADANPGVEMDPEKVAASVVDAIAGTEEHFLNRVSEGTRERLVAAGFLLDVRAGTDVVGTGIANREMFVILDGAFIAHRDGQHLNTMGTGDVFGEIAYFHGGRRTAAVRAVSDGRLLVLRPNALDELAEKRPHDVIEIYRALAAVLAERLAAV